jgi:streptogramin lyase
MSSSKGKRSVAILLTLLLLALVSTTAIASSAETEQNSVEAGAFPASKAELEALTEDAIPVPMPEDAPDAPPPSESLEDLARPEAEELLTEVFGEAIEAPAEVYDQLQVEEFRSDHVALVSGDPQDGVPPALLSSTLPLRTENDAGEDELVDLDLEQTASGLEPENPLAELEISTQLVDGFSFPGSGVSIRLASADADRNASQVGDASAFFPNVVSDSDFVVTAVPTGVETFMQMRSPEAPNWHAFDVAMPASYNLEATPDGGAKVVDSSGEIVISIAPPSAMDAQGNGVPVTLVVEGHRRLVVTATPPADAAYPILVDPQFELYDATGANTFSTAAWKAVKSPGFETADNGMGAVAHSFYGPTSPGNQAYWNYYVPRYWNDVSDPSVGGVPTSYIKEIQLSGLYFYTGGTSSPYPHMQLGLFSDNKGFVCFGAHYGYEGDLTDPSYIYKLCNPDEVTDVKRGGFALATWSNFNESLRQVVVGYASVEVTDKDSPGFGSIGAAPGWVNGSPSSAIPYVVTDPGLGIHRLRLDYPVASGGTGQVTTSMYCIGNAPSPCPRTATQTTKPLSYNPALMAQGENYVQIRAFDPVEHSEVGTARIKVDHTAPDLALLGNLTEQGKVGTNLPEYTLNYAAADGDDAAAAAQTPFGSAGTSPGQLQRPMGVAVDASGNVLVVDRENNRVVKYDSSGNFVSQFGSIGSGNGQLSDPRGIVITPAGNVWVTEAGNKRLQMFNSKGEFVRKFSYEGGPNGLNKFVEPFGVAAGPNETLWVTDLGSNKVYRFKEDGTFLNTVSGLPIGASINLPAGVGVDAFGNAWVSVQGSDKVFEFDSSGKYAFSFGGPGSSNGQFNDPSGVAIAKSGNVLVLDSGNNRVQEFKPDGSFLRQFGSLGVANGQLKEPRGVVVGPGNQLLIADAGNRRIARWAHADQDPQSGAAKVEVKVDGASVKTQAPGCATKNCSISSSWTLDADDYPAGQHKVEVFATDGVGITTTKTLNIETHGDLQAPAIALSGSMTQQASLGTTRPTYTLQVSATDPGSTEERKSGVAATTIKVDGQVVDAVSPGCPAGGCSISREWTLNSNSYPVGPHTVQVLATDGAGRTSTKTLEINIARDTTAPTFELFNAFYTAPEGWLEQKSYNYNATAVDPDGYGVTSMTLKIDGVVIKSSSGSCQVGGCSRLLGIFGTTIDMTKYDGGAHPAELIASDGAGNTRKRSWAINIDPEGHISASEAEDTLEALDATSPVNTVGLASSEAAYEGTAEGLELHSEGDLLVAQGSAAPTTLSSGAPGELEVEVPTPTSDPACPNRPAEEAEEPLTGEEEEQLALTVGCEEPPVIPSELDLLTPVSVSPVNGMAGESQTVTTNSAAAVAENVAPNVDLVTRPLFDGAMTFTAIRDASATDNFSWRVNLDEDQTLTLKDSKLAEVAYPGGRVAFTITAVPAHDAIGAAVPTSLSVVGDVLTLHVDHRSGAFVYPVVGGAGWEGGFQTYEVVMPPPEGSEEGEVSEGEFPEEGVYRETTFGPPQSASGAYIPLAAQNQSPPTRKRTYNFHECRFNVAGGVADPGEAGVRRRKAVQECHGEEGPGPEGEYWTLGWATAMHGVYFYQPHSWVWINKEPQCKKWGPRQPAKLNCLPSSKGLDGAYKPKLDILGFFRFSPGTFGVGGGAGNPVCFQLDGVLPNYWVRQESGNKVLEVTFHTYKEWRDVKEPCSWQNLEKIS